MTEEVLQTEEIQGGTGIPPSEFARKIKAKYPEYKDIDDETLARKMVEKYPEYRSQVDFGEPKKFQPQAGGESSVGTSASKPDKSQLKFLTEAEWDEQAKADKNKPKPVPVFKITDHDARTQYSNGSNKSLKVMDVEETADLVGVNARDYRDIQELRAGMFGTDHKEVEEKYANAVEKGISQQLMSNELDLSKQGMSGEFEANYDKNYPQYKGKDFTELSASRLFTDSELSDIDTQSFRNYLVKSGWAEKLDREEDPFGHIDSMRNAEDTQSQGFKYKILTEYLADKRQGLMRDKAIADARVKYNSPEYKEVSKRLSLDINSVNKALISQVGKFENLKQRQEDFKKKEQEYRDYFRGDDFNLGTEMKYYGSKAYNSVARIILNTAGSLTDMIADANTVVAGADDYNFFHASAKATDVVNDIISFDMPELQAGVLSYKSVPYKGKAYQVKEGVIYEDGIRVLDDEISQEDYSEVVKMAKTSKEEGTTVSGRAITTGALDMIGQLYMMVRTAKALPVKNYTAAAGFSGVLQAHHDRYNQIKAELEEAVRSGKLDIPQRDIEGLAKANTYMNDVVVAVTGMISPNKSLAGLNKETILNNIKSLYAKDSGKLAGRKLQEFLSSTLRESLKEVVQEESEYLLGKQVNALTNLAVNSDILSTEIKKDELAETALVTFLGTGMATGGRKFRGLVGGMDMYGVKKVLASKDSGDIAKAIEKAVAEGDISEDFGKKLNEQIFDVRKYDSKIPENIPNEKRERMLPLMKEKAALEAESKTMDTAFRESYKAKIEKVDAKINEIANEKARPAEKVEEGSQTSEEGREATPETVRTEEIANEQITDKEGEPSAEEQVADAATIAGEVPLEVGAETGTDTGNDADVQASIEQEGDAAVTEQEPEIDLKEKGKNIADQIRKAKFYSTPSEAMRNLKSDAMGSELFKAAWDSSVEIVATTVEQTGNLAQAIKKGVKSIKASDWYKGLSAEGKATAIEIFERDATEQLTPLEQAYVEAKKKSTKQTIRETTGQVDTSEKVVTTKRKQLRDAFAIQAKAAKEAYYTSKRDQLDVKGLKERLKEVVSKGKMTNSKSLSLINAALSLDNTNAEKVDRFFERFGKAMVSSEMEVGLDRLAKNKKRVKSRLKTTFGRFGDSAGKLVRMDLDNIPEDSFKEYSEVMEMLARETEIDFNAVDELFANLEEDFNDQVGQEYADKIMAVKEDSDTSKEQEILKQEMNTFFPRDADFTSYENDILHKFIKIPKDYLMSLPKAELSRIAKSIIAIKSGWFPNKTLNIVVDKYLAKEIANNIKEEVGSVELKQARSMVGTIKDIIKKQRKKNPIDFEKGIASVMLQHVDSTVKGIKGTLFYDNIVHPVTSRFNKASEETAQISDKLASLIGRAKSAREGSRVKRFVSAVLKDTGLKSGNYEFDLGVLLQLKFRQAEFNSNPELRGKKVFSIADHIAALQADKAKTNMNDETVERIVELYKEFSTEDGQIDLEKIDAYFTPEEKAIADFMREELSASQEKSREVNDHRRGETLVYTKDYFPRRTIGSLGDTNLDGVDIAEKLSGMMGTTSVRAGASNSRVINSAGAISFDTFGNFMTHVRDSNIEYNLSDVIKRTGITITELSKSGNESLVSFASALNTSMKKLVSAQFNSNIYVPKSKRDIVFKTIVRKTFTRMLIDPIRGTYDLAANYIPVYTAYADKLPAMFKANKTLDKTFKNILFSEFSSTQSGRLGGSRSVDYKESQTSSIGKNKFKQYNTNILTNLVDLYQKNKISDFSEKANNLYYDVVDKPSKHIWGLVFTEEFKKASGEAIDASAFKSDPKYRRDNSEAINRAITKADKSTSNLFNTAARSEQKLSIQATSNDWVTRFNSFMRSFTFNENRVFWDSFKSMFGKGNMSREEAVRAFAIVNVRGIAYSFASQTMLGILVSLIGGNDDDDEKDGIYEQALYRSLAQHGMLTIGGNKGAGWNLVAAIVFERAHEMVKTSAGENYNSYQDALLYAPPNKATMSQYLGMLGAEGYALKSLYDSGDLSSKLTAKLLEGEELTKEDLIELKSIQISTSLLSQLTGLPVDRMGKIAQKAAEKQ